MRSAHARGRWLWGTGGGVVFLLLGLVLVPRLSAFNFGVIEPSEAYRSNEPSSEVFERLLRTYAIRTVLHFPKSSWPMRTSGAKETNRLKAISERLGAGFVSLSLSDRTLPRRGELLQLLDLLEHASPPLLLIDRFGTAQAALASALLGIVLLGYDLPMAREAFSYRNGFFPYGPQTEVTRAFSLYEAWLTRQALAATPVSLRRWAQEGYGPYGYGARIHPVRVPPGARPGELLRVSVEVENISDRVWFRRSDPTSAIKLGLRVASEGRSPYLDLRGDFLPHDVAPGETVALSIDFVAPEAPGRYELQVDLVEEHRAWFSDWGLPPVTLSLRVD
jgi:hypothetical protein